MGKQFVIGIDLGTTNSALAYAPLASIADPYQLPRASLFSIPQVVNPGEVRGEPLLPSFLYLPGPVDFPEGSLALPWDSSADFVVGLLAQKRGVENPSRLVSSAKSWLSHAGVDRTAPILPVNAPEGVKKLSPVEASLRYLEHMRKAWNHAHPEAPLEEQRVLVTVPASFDAVARELTQRAAEQAGYRDVIVLEEPQAAFYAWIERHPDWRERVNVGDLILVVDIGGGTTDFTLITVTEREGELVLERVAVGDHILLGGDNIDLALARFVEQGLAAKNVRLDMLQLHALWQNCRVGKEKLLEEGSDLTEAPVTVLGKGAGVVGGTIKAKLQRSDVERILMDGFFPAVSSEEMPQRARRVGLQELGLPYAADAGITRHLARFLRQQASQAQSGSVRRGPSGLACPTHVLFNGGVMKARLIRERLLSVLNSWLKEEGMAEIVPLTGEDLMHAVARGATYYGLAREGRGVRIRGGVARTYYVGIESAMPAVPGIPAPLKALTVAPFGMEEGTSASIPGREFGLVVGQPAEFRFFSSTVRKNDPAGEMIEDVGEELEELAPMEVELPADGGSPGEVVPVTLESVATETGQLQLWCVARDGRRWKLEFNVRERVTAA
ncbi:MAG TPA: Hsp70 family protein [Bryobacteraceae bacterium]|nr:Hsp70 family protein [Bryobacteraceae bacterium]HOL70701.1 Hsp70 family protein [Bryobacteraceae bacterium]HPQ14637.1 Hsp70 family protein [Bryobacteraceae bacterium]